MMTRTAVTVGSFHTSARTAGGEVTTGSVDFEPNVIVDRELITGQNPRSDHAIAAKLIDTLKSVAQTQTA